jgi:glycosyltransferase involved in cell wall biosynthesis
MKKIVVAIPCYNEELSIEKVINEFRKKLPGAVVLAVDNNSKDKNKAWRRLYNILERK